jgi:uncharacterized oxidoreductase
MKGSELPRMSPDPVFAAEALQRAIAAVIRAGGSSDAEAAQVAASLVESNLRGHDSHGVGIVPRYVGALLAGGLEPNQHAKPTFDAGSLLGFDGQRGYGQVIGVEAMRLAITRARETGSCIMMLANVHHLARIGQFAEMAAAEGLVSLHFVNVLSRPLVAPWGGTDARFGTNPCCIGIPLPEAAPFVLDFATSAVAQGKLRVAHNKGEVVRPGLLLDDAGSATTDPGFAVEAPFGALLPFGEHKGYGLAIACELLGGALAGGRSEDGVPRTDKAIVNGMLSILIDPKRTGAAATFPGEAGRFVEWLRQSPPAPGANHVRLAGEPERECRERRMATGIPVDVTTWRAIGDAAEALRLPRHVIEDLATGAMP